MYLLLLLLNIVKAECIYWNSYPDFSTEIIDKKTIVFANVRYDLREESQRLKVYQDITGCGLKPDDFLSSRWDRSSSKIEPVFEKMTLQIQRDLASEYAILQQRLKSCSSFSECSSYASLIDNLYKPWLLDKPNYATVFQSYHTYYTQSINSCLTNLSETEELEKNNVGAYHTVNLSTEMQKTLESCTTARSVQEEYGAFYQLYSSKVKDPSWKVQEDREEYSSEALAKYEKKISNIRKQETAEIRAIEKARQAVIGPCMQWCKSVSITIPKFEQDILVTMGGYSKMVDPLTYCRSVKDTSRCTYTKLGNTSVGKEFCAGVSTTEKMTLLSKMSGLTTTKNSKTSQYDNGDAAMSRMGNGTDISLAYSPWTKLMMSGEGCDGLSDSYLDEWAWYFKSVRN